MASPDEPNKAAEENVDGIHEGGEVVPINIQVKVDSGIGRKRPRDEKSVPEGRPTLSGELREKIAAAVPPPTKGGAHASYEAGAFDGELGIAAPKASKSSIAAGKRQKPSFWTKEEDNLLKQAVAKCKESNWKDIAAMVGTRNHMQCLQRWMKVLTPGEVMIVVWW